MNKKETNRTNLNCRHTKAKCTSCGHEGCIYGGCKNEIYWWDKKKMLDYRSGCVKCKSKGSIIVTEEKMD